MLGVLNIQARKEPKEERAYAEISESIRGDDFPECECCGSHLEMIRRINSSDDDYPYEFWVTCGCKAGNPSYSRKGAIDTWRRGDVIRLI